jgi:hypothetical protein
VHALRLFHRAAQSGKQRFAWAAQRRSFAYQLCRVGVCWCQSGALVSDGRALAGEKMSDGQGTRKQVLTKKIRGQVGQTTAQKLRNSWRENGGGVGAYGQWIQGANWNKFYIQKQTLK